MLRAGEPERLASDRLLHGIEHVLTQNLVTGVAQVTAADAALVGFSR